MRLTHKGNCRVRSMVALARAEGRLPAALSRLLDAPGAWSTP